MTWTYQVTTATFYLNGVYQFEAEYAGAVGYYNNPNFECIKNKGPLPRGKYTIGAPHNSPNTGPYTLILIPDKKITCVPATPLEFMVTKLKSPGMHHKDVLSLI